MVVKDEDWDRLQVSREASFLQSLNWAKFQQSAGLSYHLLGGEGWTCLILIKANRIGKYLFAPYGPTLNRADDWSNCRQALVSLAKQSGASWIKFEPICRDGNLAELKHQLLKSGSRPAIHNVEPDITRVLSLDLSEDELLASVATQTRSRVKKSRADESLSFKTSTNPDDIEIFISMLQTVSERNKVFFHDPEYFRLQAKTLMAANMMVIEIAYVSGRPTACAVIHSYGQKASYTYAASLPEARQNNLAEILLWHVLINAKSRGAQEIDLFGSAPDDASPDHPWYGFSLFKKKFGGRLVEQAGTWDMSITKKYQLYRLAQYSSRKVKRR